MNIDHVVVQNPKAESGQWSPVSFNYSKTMHFDNRTNKVISVSYPSGDIVVLRPSGLNIHEGTFKIHVQYSVATAGELLGIEKTMSPGDYKKLIESKVGNNYFLTYVIDDFSAFEHDGIIDIPYLSMRMSNGRSELNAYTHRKPESSPIGRGSDGLSLSIVILRGVGDPAGPCFVRFLDFILEVQTCFLQQYEAGIYIEATSGGVSHRTKYLGWDNCPIVRCFQTREEAARFSWEDTSAEHLAAIRSQNQIEFARQEVALSKQKNEMDLEQRRIMDELNAKKEEIALQRAEQMNELKLAGERQKMHYEERSYARKDTSESLKWLPALITAGAAVFSFLT